MKFLKSYMVIALSMFISLSCQKEYSLEDAAGTATGTLKADSFGDCLPSSVNGIFKVDSTLGTGNYIDVQLNLSTGGAFTLVSDTVNGFYFKGSGTAAPGLRSVRLRGFGKPLTAGPNEFRIGFGGSECFITVTVLNSAATIAVFSLVGGPGLCAAASASGSYTKDVALNSTNTLTVSVNVTTLGAYTLGAVSANGMFFASTGTFTTLGLQNVTLNGGGTPTTAGATSLAVGNMSTSCVFGIVVAPAGGTPAVYTLGGAPGNCSAVVLAGNYQAGQPTSASNTAIFDVVVTTPGSYSITTTAVNGVTFSGSGTFANTNPQTVTLTASGTATAAGSFGYTPTGLASACNFSITYTAAAPPAVFTLQGAPGACTGATVAGVYTAGSPLTASNTVTINANVTTAGSYTISSTTVNGITFTASGVFAATGIQPIVLRATGNTPVAAGTNSFSIGTASCTFSVTCGAASASIYQCKINDVLTTFTDNAKGSYFQVGDLLITGDNLALNSDFLLNIDKAISSGTVTAATYVNTLAGSAAGGYLLGANYTDAANMTWAPKSIITGSPDPFTIIITSITATRVIGTFSGTIRDGLGAGTNTKAITEGVFNLPIN